MRTSDVYLLITYAQQYQYLELFMSDLPIKEMLNSFTCIYIMQT